MGSSNILNILWSSLSIYIKLCICFRIMDHENVRKESAQGRVSSKRLVEEESSWEKQIPNVCDLEVTISLQY